MLSKTGESTFHAGADDKGADGIDRRKTGERAGSTSEGIAPREAGGIDPSVLFKIGYGLYVVTCDDGDKFNGLIVNTVTQISGNPNKVAVNINKANYSREVISRTGILNVSILNEDAPFDIFTRFGFQSGRDADKFEGFADFGISANGLPYLTRYANGYISLKVFDTIDIGTHWMFLCTVTQTQVINDVPTMTYSYYHSNVKPGPTAKKGWVCNICNYRYEGEDLPEDMICPICKHGADDFVKIE